MLWHICKIVPQSAESLAGRVAYLELTPFTAAEVVKNDTSIADRPWVRGGFPDSFLASSDAASFEWRRAFIQTYLVIENLLSQAPPRTTAWFYRGSDGFSVGA
jgi:predicted AAA+ superfamily ATPase